MTICDLSEVVAGGHRRPMLISLCIKNLALVADAFLTFGAGLTVLTGESGSGKSVVLDALALVAGDARPRLRTRTGFASGLVEAEFSLDRNEDGTLHDLKLASVLKTHGLLSACDAEGERLVIARRVEASGRSRCYVQGQTVSRAILREIGGELLELCGQSEAHKLRTPKAQLVALDHFGSLGGERRELEKLVKQLRSLEQASQEAKDSAAEAERRRDFLEFQLNELIDCDVSQLSEQRKRLAVLGSAVVRKRVSLETLQCLKYGDNAILAQLENLICRRAVLDEQGPDDLTELSQILSTTMDYLEKACSLSEREAKSGEKNHEEADELAETIRAMDKLAEKHRISTDSLPARMEELSRELESSRQTEKEYQLLLHKVQKARALSLTMAEALHVKREAAAVQLEERLEHELIGVGLQGARLKTHLSRSELGATGITHLEFGFSANPGHEPQPLARVASGGELSRILLCFRLATDTTGTLLTFDEIDAGAGGKTAEQIAQSLLRAGEKGQVLCVSHWPQVAGVAQHHFAVEKRVESDLASTTIVEVVGEARVSEVSRMLGGTEVTARKHACELVGAAAGPVAA